MPMISYALNHEDVVLARAFRDQPSGRYIDVGAGAPSVGSVTRHFHDKGWCGVNVEPASCAGELLRAARPRDVTLAVGLAEREGPLTFYDFPTQPQMATFCPAAAERRRGLGFGCEVREVPGTTLSRIFEQHAAGEVDFLRLWVEGREADAIAGGDWARRRPRVVVVRVAALDRPPPSPEAPSWESALTGAGYVFVLFDGLNRFYVRHEEAARLAPLLSAPANALDEFVPARLEAAQSEVARLEFDVRAGRARLAALEGSLSWRLTAPVRAAAPVLARARRALAGRRAAPPAAAAAPPTPRLALPEAPVVSVIIPVHNHWHHTEQCLRSLAAHPCRNSFEVLI
ncbi:MAG TPA: FkbM family methyltransferase, partial [Gemmataceae bacterium]|nr:FkbM family methyltransferase [Gemmataceae bacterium]